MSNDLISRRSIIKKLENILLNDDLTIGEQGLLSDIVSFVAIETTAYDIDNVVEELDCDRCESCSFLKVCAGSICCRECHKKTIEIVKQGGVSDE